MTAHRSSPLPPCPLATTRHARVRQAQRALGQDALVAALLYGREIRAGGGDVFLYLGQQEVRAARRRGLRLDNHLGVTVIETRTGRIKTVYRNRKPPTPRRPGARRRSNR